MPTAERRRLPRCIHGDGVLASFNLSHAMGLALMNNCGAGGLEGLVKGTSSGLLGTRGRRDSLSDSYECHATLPGNSVLIITNARLMMVSSEEFVALEAEVEAGRQAQARGPADAQNWAAAVLWMQHRQLACQSQCRCPLCHRAACCGSSAGISCCLLSSHTTDSSLAHHRMAFSCTASTAMMMRFWCTMYAAAPTQIRCARAAGVDVCVCACCGGLFVHMCVRALAAARAKSTTTRLPERSEVMAGLDHCQRNCLSRTNAPSQAMRLYEALCMARQKYYIEPRREARGWRVTPVTATEQQVLLTAEQA